MKIGLIGRGAIAQYARAGLDARGDEVATILVRPERVAENPKLHVARVADLPGDLDLMIDCAGHEALVQYGAEILREGMDLVTVSLGALADPAVLADLEEAATAGNARLHLATGAIGALDCLQAARAGGLARVTYTGRKPPKGWRGSPAEEVLDLEAMGSRAATHFDGTAREAALRYPKNANVAAAVALAGMGFDATQVQLIADPGISENIHEIEAEGAFGRLQFQINGAALPDNPRSSALAAMSVLSKRDQLTQRVVI